MNSDDWQILADKCVVVVCVAIALLWALGVLR